MPPFIIRGTFCAKRMKVDTSFSTDSDSLNNLEIESNLEMPSQPVSPTVNVGEENEATHCSLSDDDSNPDPLIELDDFFNLVKNLPGLYLDTTSQYYYVRGKITTSGQETFYNYAKRIGTLILVGQPGSNFETISSQVFLRLGRLQGVLNGSLLPSLQHLQICTSIGSYLDHLDLFLSPSLKSLEIREIPTDDVGHSSSIMSFLNNTAEVSPDLESLVLTLGPVVVSERLLKRFIDSCVKFRHLRRLELRGVSLSMTSVDSVLSDIGSLEYLKEFILEERKEPRVPEPAAASQIRNISENTALGSSWQPQAAFLCQEPRSGDWLPSPLIEPQLQTPVKQFTSNGFGNGFGWGLGSVPVDSGLSGSIKNVVGYPIPDKPPCPSPTFELPTPSTSTTCRSGPVDSLRFGKSNVVNSPVSDKQPHSSPIEPPGSGLRTEPSNDSWGTFMETNVVGSPVSERRPLMSSLFPSLKTLQIIGTSDLIEKVVSSVTSPDLFQISITFTTITRKVSTMKRKKKKKTESTMFILSNVIERWTSLISVALTADVSETASLPNDVLRDLLVHPDLKRLEINGFDISSIDSALPELVGEAYSSQLETLLLPVKNNVPLARLRHIAMAWPNLTSLRLCCNLKLDSASSVPVETIKMDPIVSHKLESLIIATGGDDQNSSPVQQKSSMRMLKIAAYIDSLFPDLMEMEAVVVDGDFGQQHFQCESEFEWAQVFDMVKLLQTVRVHDRQRFRLKPQGLISG